MKANSDCAFDDEYLSQSHHFLKENREEKIERLCILVSRVGNLFMNIFMNIEQKYHQRESKALGILIDI